MEASESSWVIENTKSMATASDRMGARKKRRAPRLETTRNEVAKGQDQQFTRNATTDVPEAFTPPSKYPRWPIETVNPLHRRGRLKTNPRKVSQANPLATLYGRVETVPGESDRSESLYMDCARCTGRSDPRGAIREHEGAASGVT